MKLFDMPAVILSALAAVAVGSAGCSETVYFTPVGQGPGGGNRGHYVLAAEEGGATAAFLSARGVTGNSKKDDDRQFDRLIISISLRNRLDKPVTLPAKSFFVVDDDNTRLDQPAVRSKQADASGVVAPPSRSAKADVTFLLPEDGSLLRIGSFRLFWSADVGGKVENYETKFILSPEPEDYYAYPYPYPYPYDFWGPYPYGYGFGYFHGGGHHGGGHHGGHGGHGGGGHGGGGKGH